MSLNEFQKENLQKLGLDKGTGIFGCNVKADSVNCPVVVIGLGGLGCKTVENLKQKADRRINEEDNSIRFLGIDSDESDLYRMKERGILSAEELLSVYTLEAPLLCAKKEAMPSYIKKWMNPELTPRISEYNCGGVRQNARFLLAIPQAYHKVRAKLKAVLMSAINACPMGRLNIIFVAGISGATGSGILTDMCYLVQDVMKTELGVGSRDSYQLLTYLYMPDVQFEYGRNFDMLKHNAYAALKEFDYYYNLKDANGVYEWPFEEGEIKNSKENAADYCVITSVTSKETIVTESVEYDTVDRLSESIMTLISNPGDGHEYGYPHIVLQELRDCYPALVANWLNSCGGDENLFPKNANYNYNIISQGGVKVPVEEIMSYVAWESYKNVLNEYTNTESLETKDTKRFMFSVGAGDSDVIINKVKEYMQYGFLPLELPSGRDIHNIRGSYTIWKERMFEHYISCRVDKDFGKALEKVALAIADGIETGLEQTFCEKGPYFVSKMINAKYECDGVPGLVQIIDDIIKGAEDEYNVRTEMYRYYDQLSADLDSRAVNTPSVLGIIRPDDREAFLYGAVSLVEKFTIEKEILLRMRTILEPARERLVYLATNVYGVYAEVCDHVEKILKRNCEGVVNGVCKDLNLPDAVNLDCYTKNGRRLKLYIDSAVEKFSAKFKDKFEVMLRDPYNRIDLTDGADEFKARERFNKLFDEVFGELYRDASERFLIVYYAENDDFANEEKLESVMNNPDEKHRVLLMAAKKICQMLKAEERPMCRLGVGTFGQLLEGRRYIYCPSILFDAMLETVPLYFENVCIFRSKIPFIIKLFGSYMGVPLLRIQGMADMYWAYDFARTKGVAGLHLDEGENSPYPHFPEPFVQKS